MKVAHESTPVERTRSLRGRPYDLRRRVLVNNFLKDQHPPKLLTRPPTPRIPYQLQTDRNIGYKRKNVFAAHEDSSIVRVLNREGISEKVPLSNERDPGVTVAKPRTEPRQNDDFLQLLSRRLRNSETSRLRQPCRKSRSSRSLIPVQNKKTKLSKAQEKQPKTKPLSSISRKRIVFKSKKRTKHLSPLRTPENLKSYPTFERLNEICSCDSATYKKVIGVIRGSPITTKREQKSVSNSVVKRTSSLRRSLSKILKRKSTSTTVIPALSEVHPVRSITKMEKRRSFVSTLFSPFANKSWEGERQICKSTPRPASITRSSSLRTPPTLGAPRLVRRAQSVKLRCVRLTNDAF